MTEYIVYILQVKLSLSVSHANDAVQQSLAENSTGKLKIYFATPNTIPHMSLKPHQKIKTVGREVLPLPLHSKHFSMRLLFIFVFVYFSDELAIQF